jgi:uncharacterized protein YggU (UPF0235/DUF167 family)
VSEKCLEQGAANVAEFTKLKQKWQQSKSSVYLAKNGETILPGFKGQYHE